MPKFDWVQAMIEYDEMGICWNTFVVKRIAFSPCFWITLDEVICQEPDSLSIRQFNCKVSNIIVIVINLLKKSVVDFNDELSIFPEFLIAFDEIPHVVHLLSILLHVLDHHSGPFLVVEYLYFFGISLHIEHVFFDHALVCVTKDLLSR